MAGRGSRFVREGITLPKPLVELAGAPFFWWAAESVRRQARVRESVFVVLEEHVATFRIDQRIHDFYPDAQVVAIPEVTSGAAETAAIGVRALSSDGPIAINDSDHAFVCPELDAMAARLAGELDGALLCFRSADPAYSYVCLDEADRVVGTVEKEVVSPLAIAGCYLFSEPRRFLSLYEGYLESCPYEELFVSGLYNRLADGGGRIGTMLAGRHLSFGTPEELSRIDPSQLRDGAQWLGSAPSVTGS
jgi:NDP-sugar pyrophosphorylase family protein